MEREGGGEERGQARCALGSGCAMYPRYVEVGQVGERLGICKIIMEHFSFFVFGSLPSMSTCLSCLHACTATHHPTWQRVCLCKRVEEPSLHRLVSDCVRACVTP